MSEDDRYRRFNLRIPKEDFALLQEAADARSHSMNAEIVQRLEASLSAQSEAAKPKSVAVPSDMQLTPEAVEWLGLWDDMTDSQRRRTLAVLKAVINADAA